MSITVNKENINFKFFAVYEILYSNNVPLEMLYVGTLQKGKPCTYHIVWFTFEY